MSERCQEYVLIVFRGCLEGVLRGLEGSEKYQEGVWKLSVWCLDGV